MTRTLLAALSASALLPATAAAQHRRGRERGAAGRPPAPARLGGGAVRPPRPGPRRRHRLRLRRPGRQLQLEASAFKGREPDEHRWNIEAPRLDSWSVRATWTLAPYLAIQASHGVLKTPEEQHPGENEHRTTASVQYARAGLTTTFAYSLKDRSPGRALSAFLAEATYELTPRHAVFGRVENVRNDELFPDHDDPLHDRAFRVTRAEAGYAYRLPITGALGVALGGTVAIYVKPGALDAAYGRFPVSGTIFARLALGL